MAICTLRSTPLIRHVSTSGSWKRVNLLWSARRQIPSMVQASSSEEQEFVEPHLLDMRVGKILTCDKHPDADELFIEEIDVGEDEPRTICSGLVPYLAAEELRERLVVVLCNLKARKLCGVSSHGMLLCASNRDNGIVKPLIPPAAATIGESIVVGDGQAIEPASENRIKKKKIWEKLQPLMRTNDEGVATCNGIEMHVESGPVTCRELINTPIS